ncbi:hypothetical protein O181_008715 [Austropuccinia psidii MF-1]|uniref:Uncharacterized protein n=1 Tax=Austropuccinia psidii MF-1 TaxID=1389203 RepID=A0A9Q3GJ60_9BASI|nr:hypothetical protein [Austropuccinia psidii MF-1]
MLCVSFHSSFARYAYHVQCANAYGTTPIPIEKGVHWTSCTAYGNIAYRCMISTCHFSRKNNSRLSFEFCSSRIPGKKAIDLIYPEVYEAFNTCGLIKVTKGTDKTGKPLADVMWCGWKFNDEPNAARLTCGTCELGSYHPRPEYTGDCNKLPKIKG